MASNKYYDEWDEPREAVLLRETVYLIHKHYLGDERDKWYCAPAGERVLIVGRMTEDTRDSYGGRWLYSAAIRDHGALVEEGIDFEFVGED